MFLISRPLKKGGRGGGRAVKRKKEQIILLPFKNKIHFKTNGLMKQKTGEGGEGM